MAADDRTGYRKIWKSIDLLMKEAFSTPKSLQQRVSKEPNGSPQTTADVIQLEDILLKGELHELSEPRESLVQRLYTCDQAAKHTVNKKSPTFFSEKLARLICDICADDSSVQTPATTNLEAAEQKDLKVSDVHNFFPLIFSSKMSAKSQSSSDSKPISSEVRAVLMEMIDSQIARWIDENIASILEDALRSSKSGARDAQVNPRSQ